MRGARRTLVPPVGPPVLDGHRVAWTLVESLLALVVLGALLGLGVGFALTRTVELLLSTV